MLGRLQQWHNANPALFNRCVETTDQTMIQVRGVQDVSGAVGQDNNPFDWETICSNIEEGILQIDLKWD